MPFGERLLSFATTALRGTRGGGTPDVLSHTSRIEQMQLAKRMPNLTGYKQLARDTAKVNAVVLACVQHHLVTFPQGSLIVTDTDGNALVRKRGEKKASTRINPTQRFTPAARLQQLLDKPNPVMSQSQLRRLCGLYELLCGNAYLWKQRAVDGSVVALWPFHGGQMFPVPGADVNNYIACYRYTTGDGTAIDIAPSEVIHLQWPFMPDPENALIGLGPVMGVARDIAIDNEATRYVWAYLANDAVVSTLWTFPSDASFSDSEFEKMKAEVVRKFSGNARGRPAIVTEGVTVEKLGSNMKELQPTNLHAVAEVRIASVMRVRPILAGLNAGLENGREGNYESERRVQTEDTLMPWWDQTVDDLDCGLTEPLAGGIAPDFDGDLMISLDTSNVGALKENAADVLARGTTQSVTIKDLQIAYYDGKLPRDAAMANAQKFFPDLDTESVEGLFAVIDPSTKTPPPNELRTTVGGANAVMLLPQQVKEGKTTLDAARSMCVVTFGYTDAEAKQLLPDSLVPKESTAKESKSAAPPVAAKTDDNANTEPPIEPNDE